MSIYDELRAIATATSSQSEHHEDLTRMHMKHVHSHGTPSRGKGHPAQTSHLYHSKSDHTSHEDMHKHLVGKGYVEKNPLLHSGSYKHYNKGDHDISVHSRGGKVKAVHHVITHR